MAENHAHHEHGHRHEGHDHDHHGGVLGRLRHAVTPHSHDSAEAVASALGSTDRGIRAVKISLAALMLTAVLQMGIVAISGSVALLADTIHNFSDALTAVPLWIAFVLGRRAATHRHTYGYGRAEDLAGLFVIAMIALSAVLAGWQAVSRLMDPAPVEKVGWVAAAGVIGFLGNEAVAAYRIREGNAIGSAALIADGHHARTDGLTSLAVVLGAGGAAMGWQWADPVIGLVITAMILMVLRQAAREVFRRLLDGVDPHLVEDAEAALETLPGVLAVGRVRLRWIGHELHADAELHVDPSMSLESAHELAHAAEGRLRKALPRLRGAVVHAYPRREDLSCVL